MLTEAEGKVQLTTGSPAERNVTNEAIKKLLTTTEPCSGNTALHWASMSHVNFIGSKLNSSIGLNSGTGVTFVSLHLNGGKLS